MTPASPPRQGEDRGRQPAHRRLRPPIPALIGCAPQRLRLLARGGGRILARRLRNPRIAPAKRQRRKDRRHAEPHVASNLSRRQRAMSPAHRRCLRRHRFRATRGGRAARAPTRRRRAARRWPTGPRKRSSAARQRPHHRRADHELRGLLGTRQAREAARRLAGGRVQAVSPSLDRRGTDRRPAGIKDIMDSGHVDRIIGSSGAKSLQGGAGNSPMYPS